MLFDWAQKKAVFGYHNRRVPSARNGRRTTAGDVLESSTLHQGIFSNWSLNSYLKSLAFISY